MTQKSHAKDQFLAGTKLFANSEYDLSIDRFSQALTEDATFELAYLSRGAAHMRTNRIRDAIADFDKAIELHPDHERAYNLRGIARSTTGNLEEALRDFDRAISINPEYGAAYLGRANIHALMGHEKSSEEDMRMAVHLGEKNVQEFAAENNIWRSAHLRLEAEGIASEFER